MNARTRVFLFAAVATTALAGIFSNGQPLAVAGGSSAAINNGYTDEFFLEDCELLPNGANNYFILEPGYKLVLEGEEDGEPIHLTITVLDETKMVDGIETRIVEERELEGGELIEVSRNYFAMCKETNDIFYFGEDVDMYEEGELVSHEGAWLAGNNNATAGLLFPANPQVGMKYYQEIAPGVAEDRAEIVSLDETVDTPAGEFDDVLKVEESTPLEPGVTEFKFYARSIGMVQEKTIQLVEYELPEPEGPVEVELKQSVESVVVAENTIEVNINSSSTISDFELDQENKKLAFKVNGDTGTVGTTEIRIGRILEGPYVVTVDGQVTGEAEVITGETSVEALIKIRYSATPHDIAVTGTNVVPEFPLPLIGMIGGLIGIVAILTRTRLSR